MTNVAAPTVGILYPGEMGSAFGRLLLDKGIPVVTTLAGRGGRTGDFCRENRFQVLESLGEVAARADIVLSLVPPNAALSVAEEYCRCHAELRRVYVDLNSISPVTASRIGELCADAGVDFVDGAVHGLAKLLPARGVLYLSGPSARRVAELFSDVQTRVLSAAAGDASAFKMLISGVNKGVIALFVEVCLAAQRASQLDPFLACCREAYPGVMSIVERVLPTCPQHAARRAEEMHEAEQTLEHYGLEPRMIAAARHVFAEMAGAEWAERSDWSVLEVLGELHNRELLSQPTACS